MTGTQDVDTSDLIRVQRVPIAAGPSLDPPAKNPFFVSNIPTTSIVNGDAARNFYTPQIPTNRIVPALPLTLSGAASNSLPAATVPSATVPPPPAPTIAQSLQSIAAGYQFSFNEVRLPVSSTFSIATYRVYRGPSNDSSQAAVIDTIPHNPTQLSTPVIVQDNVPNGTTQFYFVSAINSRGKESSLTPAQSGAVTNTAGFNSNSQLASSFHSQGLNVAFAPTSATTLSNPGIGTTITVAATTNQYGAGTVSYNSGSVDPGLNGTWAVYFDDPTFAGGPVIFQATSTSVGVQNQVANDARQLAGAIATSIAGATTGGGLTGGTTQNPTGGGAGIPASGGRGFLQL